MHSPQKVDMEKQTSTEAYDAIVYLYPERNPRLLFLYQMYSHYFTLCMETRFYVLFHNNTKI